MDIVEVADNGSSNADSQGYEYYYEEVEEEIASSGGKSGRARK